MHRHPFLFIIITMKLIEKKIKSKKIYAGKILDFYLDEIKTPSGHKATREYSKHVFAVGAIVEVDGYYILEKQYRYPLQKIIIEIPAGKSDKGETPLAAVKREVKEETGYLAEKIIPLGTFHPAPAYSDEVLYLFYFKARHQSKRKLDEDEAINLLRLTKKEVLKLLDNYQITDSKTIIAFSRLFNLCSKPKR